MWLKPCLFFKQGLIRKSSAYDYQSLHVGVFALI